jgi:hypothetical protein
MYFKAVEEGVQKYLQTLPASDVVHEDSCVKLFNKQRSFASNQEQEATKQ